MNFNHSSEPWRLGRLATPDHTPQYGISAEGSDHDLAIVIGPNSKADGERIVAAVNACKGIEHPEVDLPWLITTMERMIKVFNNLPDKIVPIAAFATIEQAKGALERCGRNPYQHNTEQ